MGASLHWGNAPPGEHYLLAWGVMHQLCFPPREKSSWVPRPTGEFEHFGGHFLDNVGCQG